MVSSSGFLVMTLMLICFVWYLVLRHLYHIEINSQRDSLWSIAWPLTMFGSMCFISGALLVLNPSVSSSLTTKLSEVGFLNADFTAELPKIEAFEAIQKNGKDAYEWKTGDTKITILAEATDNHQWNVMVPGGKPEKVEGGIYNAPPGTATLMIWRQRIRPGIASEVRVITPNK